MEEGENSGDLEAIGGAVEHDPRRVVQGKALESCRRNGRHWSFGWGRHVRIYPGGARVIRRRGGPAMAGLFRPSGEQVAWGQPIPMKVELSTLSIYQGHR
jgi:hypothetical protein